MNLMDISRDTVLLICFGTYIYNTVHRKLNRRVRFNICEKYIIIVHYSYQFFTIALEHPGTWCSKFKDFYFLLPGFGLLFGLFKLISCLRQEPEEGIFRTLFRRARLRFPDVPKARLEVLVVEAILANDDGLIDNAQFPARAG